MALTEAQKLVFALWILDLLRENKSTIESAKQGVTFDVEGNLNLLKGKQESYSGEEGKLTALDEQKKRQTAAANLKLEDFYKASSNIADAIVGHIEKDHALSKMIRNKRDSMSLEAARGSQNPQNPA